MRVRREEHEGGHRCAEGLDLLLRGVAALSPASHDDLSGLVSKAREDTAIPLLDRGPDGREVAERESEMLLQERANLGPIKERAVVLCLH